MYMHLPNSPGFMQSSVRFLQFSAERLRCHDAPLDCLHRQEQTHDAGETKTLHFFDFDPKGSIAMRTKLLLAASAALFALNASAHDIGDARVHVAGAQPKQVHLTQFAFDRIQGEYQLGDGRVLSVTGKGAGKERKLYADLGDGPVEMVHVGKHRFEGRDRNVRISFDTVGNKQPELVRVTAPTRG